MEVALPVDHSITAAVASNSSTVGNVSCAATGLFDTHPVAERTCIAGCCVDNRCRCREGYVGDLCNLELRCAIIPPGADTFSGIGGDVCATREETLVGRVVCTCRQLGVVAVLRLQITPPSYALTPSNVRTLAPRSALFLAQRPAPLLIAAATLLLLLLAALADARTRHLSTASPLLPQWLRPEGFSFRSELINTLLTRTTIMRIWWVYPSFTVYTHAQLLLVLVVSVAVKSLCIAMVRRAFRDSHPCALRPYPSASRPRHSAEQPPVPAARCSPLRRAPLLLPAAPSSWAGKARSALPRLSGSQAFQPRSAPSCPPWAGSSSAGPTFAVSEAPGQPNPDRTPDL